MGNRWFLVKIFSCLNLEQQSMRNMFIGLHCIWKSYKDRIALRSGNMSVWSLFPQSSWNFECTYSGSYLQRKTKTKNTAVVTFSSAMSPRNPIMSVCACLTVHRFSNKHRTDRNTPPLYLHQLRALTSVATSVAIHMQQIFRSANQSFFPGTYAMWVHALSTKIHTFHVT